MNAPAMAIPTDAPAPPPGAPLRRGWLFSDEDERLFDALRAGTPLAGPVVRLRPLALGGRWIGVRPGTCDVVAFERAFAGGAGDARQSPPVALTGAPARPLTIVDCGCGVGYSTSALLHAHPVARVIGVNMDARSVDLARRELSPHGPRAQVIHAAVWGSSGVVEAARGASADGWTSTVAGLAAYGAAPSPGATGAAGASSPSTAVPAVVIPELLDQLGISRLDYLHLDIAGSEAAVFDAPREWLRRIACIKVHVSAPADPKRIAWRLSEQGLSVVSTVETPATEASACFPGSPASTAVSAVSRELRDALPRFPQPSPRPDPPPGPW